MRSLTLEWDQSQLKPLRERGLERALFRALSKGGGDAIRAARVASSRTVRFRKRMKVAAVNDGLPLTYSPRAREISDLVWRIGVSGRAMPMSSFPYRQTKRGVSVAVNKGKRKLLRGAFIATMKSGHTGIFQRVSTGPALKTKRGKTKLPPRARRLPIDELFSTRISDVFADNGMIPAVHNRAQAVFAKTFERVLPLELAKLQK